MSSWNFLSISLADGLYYAFKGLNKARTKISNIGDWCVPFHVNMWITSDDLLCITFAPNDIKWMIVTLVHFERCHCCYRQAWQEQVTRIFHGFADSWEYTNCSSYFFIFLLYCFKNVLEDEPWCNSRVAQLWFGCRRFKT